MTLTNQDYAISATSHMMREYVAMLGQAMIADGRVKHIVDLGCGYGGIALTTGEFFGTTEVYGADIDVKRVAIARERGVKAVVGDLSRENGIPLAKGYFDLVISCGVIEHVHPYDVVIQTARDLLRERGLFLVTWPNLASYVQIISLVLGYQPADVEVSNKVTAGNMYAPNIAPVGHIHAATERAMRDLLKYYGFEILTVRKANPQVTGRYARLDFAMKIAHAILPRLWSRRLILLARKK